MTDPIEQRAIALLPAPIGYCRVLDHCTEIHVGTTSPPNRAGGLATPWAALYDRPAAVSAIAAALRSVEQPATTEESSTVQQPSAPEPVADKRCDMCGFIGTEDPVIGCPRCRWDEMRVIDAPPAPRSDDALRSNDAPREAAHPDDEAVDRFAEALKAKLADARAKGRGGWQEDESGMQQRLSDMLREHVAKGDPRDVANFCMFLHQRGEAILPPREAAQEPEIPRCPSCGYTNEDCRTLMDHHLCGLPDPPPPQRREGSPLRPVTDEDVDAAMTAVKKAALEPSPKTGDRIRAALESFHARLAGEGV